MPKSQMSRPFNQNQPSMNLIERAKNILLTPNKEWDVVNGEEPNIPGIITGYVLPLAGAAAVDLVSGDLVVHRYLKDTKTHTRLGKRVLDEEILALVVPFKYDNASRCRHAESSGEEEMDRAHGEFTVQDAKISDPVRYSEGFSTTCVRTIDREVARLRPVQ